MARIRNASGEDLYVPFVARVVKADEVLDVPDDHADSFVCQSGTWEAEKPAEKPAAKKTTTKKSTSNAEES